MLYTNDLAWFGAIGAWLLSRLLQRAPDKLRLGPWFVTGPLVGFVALGFLGMLADFRIPIPEGYGLLVKALVTVEGVARAIYPDIDVVRTAGPFATRLVVAQLARPERLRERVPAALRAALRELVA